MLRGEYVQQASTAPQVRHLVDRAVRIAKAERRVTALIIPNDIQETKPYEEPAREHGTIHSGIGYTAPRDRATSRICAALRTC